MFRTLIATMKKYFESSAFTGKQIDKVLFPTLDESDATTVSVDKYTGQPYAARTIKQGQPARVRLYKPGSGFEFEPPLQKEKTPIDEKLRDSVVAGVEATAPQAQHMQQVVRQIVDGPMGHRPAHAMARNKMAIDVYRTGIFTATDEIGVVEQFDFLRDSNLDRAYDFAAGGASFDEMVVAMYQELSVFGIPKGNLAVILGATVLAEYEGDAIVTAKRLNNDANILAQQNMVPTLLEGAEGLYIVGRYQADGMAVPVWILSYDPDFPYLAEEGGTPEPFLPDDEAVMFNVGGIAWHFNRGIDVKSADGNSIVRAVGDIVIDTFTSDDAPITWIRSNARPFFARGQINHTSRTTCTFA